MNDLILYLYLIDVFTNLDCGLIFVLFVLTLLLILTSLGVVCHAYDDGLDSVKPFLNKVCKPALIVWCVLSLLKAVIPSTQTMYIALGLHTANQVMQQPQIAQVDNQAMRILQAKLDEYEKELTQGNKGEVKK